MRLRLDVCPADQLGQHVVGLLLLARQLLHHQDGRVMAACVCSGLIQLRV